MINETLKIACMLLVSVGGAMVIANCIAIDSLIFYFIYGLLIGLFWNKIWYKITGK